MRNNRNTYKKKQKQLATSLTTLLNSPETLFSLLSPYHDTCISDISLNTLWHPEAEICLSTLQRACNFSAFESTEHYKEVIKLLLGSRVHAVSKSKNIEKDFSFSLQHIQLDSAFPLCPGLLGPGSSNSHVVFYTAEVHCFNLG